jgi:hypothetical protein
MDIGLPQLSLAALVDLRAAVHSTGNISTEKAGFVTSVNEESGSDEKTAKTILPAADAANRLRNEDSTGSESARGRDKNSGPICC